jgi:hypothetical protein
MVRYETVLVVRGMTLCEPWCLEIIPRFVTRAPKAAKVNYSFVTRYARIGISSSAEGVSAP